MSQGTPSRLIWHLTFYIAVLSGGTMALKLTDLGILLYAVMVLYLAAGAACARRRRA
jgi:hypothetical protein